MEIPRFHHDTIETIRQQADIVELISEQVVLRKRGKDYLGLCPFHEEKTPSFSVSPSKQLYYCFGCGAGGNVFKFLMELGQQSFSDVVLELARRYQVPVRTLEPQQQQELQRQLSLREQLYEILAVATTFYHHALFQSSGTAALEYLKKQRGLQDTTINQFQLGYAPGGWETLYRYLVEQKRYAIAAVETAGLIQPRKSGSGYIDRFRERLIVPIYDVQGRVIGFGGRTLTDEEPKYLNSPQTPLFDKGKTLFALDKARQEISKQDRVIVVEGYFDAIALHSAGITNTVASLGTAFSSTQLKQVLRYCESKQVIFNFDTDTAGTQATQRAIAEIEPLVYSGQVQLRILTLPDGKDADEFLLSHPDAVYSYRQLIDDAPLWLDWQIEQLLQGQDLSQSDRLQQVAKRMVKLLSHLDNAHLRTHYLHVCAERLARGDTRLVNLYSQDLLAQLKKPSTKRQDKTPPPLRQLGNLLATAEALLLKVYLHCSDYREEIITTLETQDLGFSQEPYRLLWDEILTLSESHPELFHCRAEALLSLFQERGMDNFEILAPLFYLGEKQARDISRPKLVMKAAIATMEQLACEKRKRYCLEQWQQLDPNTEADRFSYYYQEFYATQRRIEQLNAERQVSIQDLIEEGGSLIA